MSKDRSYCCDEFEQALKDERLRPGIGRYWFYEISAWVYECPFCHTCPFCNRSQKSTVTMTEIENAVGDTSEEYTEGVVELFESKGFMVMDKRVG